jgi:ribonuclease HIII
MRTKPTNIKSARRKNRMKVAVNGTISKEALKIILETQKAKTIIIDDFCRENKITNFQYKDSELEYQVETKITKPKVEVRTND